MFYSISRNLKSYILELKHFLIILYATSKNIAFFIFYMILQKIFDQEFIWLLFYEQLSKMLFILYSLCRKITLYT